MAADASLSASLGAHPQQAFLGEHAAEGAGAVVDATHVGAPRAAGAERPQVEQDPVVEADVAVEPHGVVQAGAAASEVLDVDVAEPRAKVAGVGEGAGVDRLVVGGEAGAAE